MKQTSFEPQPAPTSVGSPGFSSGARRARRRKSPAERLPKATRKSALKTSRTQAKTTGTFAQTAGTTAQTSEISARAARIIAKAAVTAGSIDKAAEMPAKTTSERGTRAKRGSTTTARASKSRSALGVVLLLSMGLCELVQSSVQVQQQIQEQQQQHLVGDSDAVVLDGGGGGGAETGSSSGTERCAKKRLQQCLSLLQTLSTDHNLAFAADEQQLKEMCKTMRSGLSCVNDHVSLCFEPRHRQRIKQLLMGTEKTVHLLCHKGPLREKYLQHAPCMRNVSTDTDLCGSHYKDLISSVDVRDNLSSQDTIRQQCCAFHTYLACVGVAAERRCGPSAGQFVEEYSYRTAGTIILTRCRGYQPGSAMCSLALPVASAPSRLLLLLVAAGTIIIAFSV